MYAYVCVYMLTRVAEETFLSGKGCEKRFELTWESNIIFREGAKSAIKLVDGHSWPS